MFSPSPSVKPRCGDDSTRSRFQSGAPFPLTSATLTVALFMTFLAEAAAQSDGEARGRKDGARTVQTADLVTGDPAAIRAVVAGTPPTAIMKIVPVPAKVGSYPPGTTIEGNELRASTGGFRAWFEFKLSDWDPNGNNVPPLHFWHFRFETTGYEDADAPGDQPNLAPPVIACTNNAQCAAAFGEAWAECSENPFPFGRTCLTAYGDWAGTGRADSWCADTGSGACFTGLCDNASPSFVRCASVYSKGVARPDAGIEYYGATIVVDIPAEAKGKYTVNFRDSQTFLEDTASNKIPTLVRAGFVVNILTVGSRSLAFSTTPSAAAAGPGNPTAIRVTMVDLHHPVPANAPANAPNNYTTFDTTLNGVCIGGSHEGHHCDTDADCRVCVSGSGPTLNRVCASDADCAGGAGSCPAGGTCSSLTGCTAAGEENGCARWVGKPGTFLESQDTPGLGGFRAARLQCTPFYFDWATETAYEPITIVGGEIVPSSSYEIEVFDASCEGNEDSCLAVSAPVAMITRRFGDVVAPYNPPATSHQPDGTDVVQLVNKFRNLLGAPGKAKTQLQPNLVELNGDVSGSDITQCVNAFKQFAYPFSGPCPCPSQAACGALECPGGASVCIDSGLSGLGTGATCVKTCTGGDNDGDPCINDSHCPNGGACGNPFCRDRCGRCSP